MKEKIDLFAKGVFSYEKPELNSSENGISITVEMGKVFKGSFCVSASDGRRFKGLAYSTESLLTFEEKTFAGTEITIHYSYDATHLDIGDASKGRISLVTDAGELDIPFQARVRAPSCDTSIGPASDLFHFTSLAQTDWSEAKALFGTEEFRRTLIFYDSKYDNLYRTLNRSGNASLALEEFLVAVKKLPVELRAGASELSYENPKEAFSDSITIYRNGWGYSQVAIETIGDFLKVERRLVWTDDFVGNAYQLQFVIDPEYLHIGTNLGKLIIKAVHQVIEIPVIIKNADSDLKSSLARRKRRHLEMKLLSNYIEFKTGRLSITKFVSEENKTLDNLRVFRPEGIFDRMLRIFLLIETGHEDQAIAALSVIFEDEEWGDDAFFYAVALYLKARTEHEQSQIAALMQRIREIYENTLDARIFIFCISLDRKGRLSPNNRFDALKRGVNAGNASPVVLCEACHLINDEPTVLRELSDFELRVIMFGLKQRSLNKNAILQLAYLASREKESRNLLIDILIRACEQFHINEILETLCLHLVRAEKHDKTAFKWLSIGIIEQVPVKNIFENCLLAAGKTPDKALPKAMQTYFDGGITLDDTAKATFFANVMRFRGNSDSISVGLFEQIKNFTERKLSEGLIDENLAVLYNSVPVSGNLTNSQIAKLPDIIYKHLIVTESDNITSILVSHKELEKESLFEVTDGRAFVDIFSEDAVILYCDEFGNRILPPRDSHGNAGYSIARLVTNSDLIHLCLENCRDDSRVVLNCLENARYRGDSEDTIDLVKCCIEEDGLEPGFRLECYRELVEYYYDNLEGELMEDILVRLDLSAMCRRDRSRMLEFMILRELYSLAMKNMELYGYTGVDVKRLAKLASRLIEVQDERVGTEMFTDICFTVFRKKKYDEKILQYLSRYYNGDSENMYFLWTALVENGVEADELEERLLSQLLFTESDMSYSKDVFRHYYGHGGNRKLIRAFVSYYAYKYIVFDQVPEDIMLELMRRESCYDDNDLNMLALIKYLSQQKTLSDEDRSFAEINMNRLEKKNMVMPFFKDFGESIHIPEAMRDKQYVEYHTDPRRRVRIHYCLVNDSKDAVTEYIDADMNDVGYGIFISEFVLFYGEMLQYYITEEDEDNCTITESSEISLSPELIGNEETCYHRLNLIITSREMNDVKTMQKLLESYIRNDYLSKNLFEPIL